MEKMKTFGVPLSLYCVLVAVGSVTSRDKLGPDSVCYARNAMYIVDGRFLDSVSGYFSPLISWCAVPLVYAGVEAVVALRVVLAIWGFLLIFASEALLRTLALSTTGLRIPILSLIAILAGFGAVRIITPDLMMGACLVAYSATTVSPTVVTRKSQAALCGFLGGVAFLAKAYALPFVLAHFAFVCVLHWVPRRKTVPARRVIVKWLLGMCCFAIVAAPWIGLMTYKYGEFSISKVGRIAHTITGPADVPRFHPAFLGLHVPPPGRIHMWEVPEALPYNHWSPFENPVYFRHQVRQVGETGWTLVRHIQDFDTLRTSLLALLLLPLICYRTTGFVHCVWTTVTVALYASGFLLVFYEERYILFYLWPLLCVYCLGFGCELVRNYCEKAAIPKRIVIGVGVIWVASFAGRSVEFVSKVIMPRDRFCYRTIAHELQGGMIEGATAGTDANDYYACYLANRAYLGEPMAKTVRGVEVELSEHGTRVFLVHASWPLADTFQQSTLWRCVQTILDGGETVYIFLPRAEVPGAESVPGSQSPALPVGGKEFRRQVGE